MDFTARVKSFILQKEEAASIVEYALLLALITLGCLLATAALGTTLSDFFVDFSEMLPN